MSDVNNTIIIVASSVGGVLFCLVVVACCCAFIFYKKHRKLVKEKERANTNGEQQTLNNGSSNTSRSGSLNKDGHGALPTDANQPTSSQPSHVTAGTTPYSTYSQDGTTTSSDYRTTTGGNGKWDGFDASFLVHPEQFTTNSMATNSGNDGNLKFHGDSLHAAMGMAPPNQVNKATFPASQSPQPPLGAAHFNGNMPASRQPPSHVAAALPALSMNHSIQQGQDEQVATNGGDAMSNSGARMLSSQQQHHINMMQEKQRKEVDQRARLQEIVRNARNKLQMIDSRHISFEYEIGRGKFGKVFRALWTDFNTKQPKTVAVKWFKQDEVNEEIFEDFVKEISVAAHLPPHENVLQIYGFCISPYALVTEFVNGGSVEICVSCKHSNSIRSTLTIGDVVQMFIDTAKGISHLHTVGIVHRDVAARNLLIEDLTAKEELEETQQHTSDPSNLFDNYMSGDLIEYDDNKNSNKRSSHATSTKNQRSSSSQQAHHHHHHHHQASSDNKKRRKGVKKKSSGRHKTKSIPENLTLPHRRVVVCDFGLSRITRDADQDNFTNSHVGPLKWMSPESIKQQIYNSKTDVYSFGVVMWEVLCGMPPYPNTKVLSLAVEVISKQTRPFILPWFPRPLQVLMQRCWQEIPEFRPTFEEIKNELELFKKQLIESNALNEPLQTTEAAQLAHTKEKLRSIHHLVDEYLDPSTYSWDGFVKPKLQKLIEVYDDQHNLAQMQAHLNALENQQQQQQTAQPQPHTQMPVLNARSISNNSTYYTSAPIENASPSLQGMPPPLSVVTGASQNKRISLELNAPPNTAAAKPRRTHNKVKFADDHAAIANNNAEHLTTTHDTQPHETATRLMLIATESLSMNDATNYSRNSQQIASTHTHAPDVSVSINQSNTELGQLQHHRHPSSKPGSMADSLPLADNRSRTEEEEEEEEADDHSIMDSVAIQQQQQQQQAEQPGALTVMPNNDNRIHGSLGNSVEVPPDFEQNASNESAHNMHDANADDIV